MKAFAELFTALDQTTKTGEKVEAMVRYFSTANAADAAWAIYFLTGRKPKQAVPAKKLRQWAGEIVGLPDWLLDECFDAVGDSAEAIALLLPEMIENVAATGTLSDWVEKRLLTLRALKEEEQKSAVLQAWGELNAWQRLVWNKLISGGFRIGVSHLLVVRALAKTFKLTTEVVSHRLMGEWSPTPEFYERLISGDADDSHLSRPYPFFLAYPLEDEPETLGIPGEWQAEWKWDGIRAQLVRRQGQTFVWSRGEELVTERYPELKAAGERLPDGTVLDGELLPWKQGEVLPFALLQKRIGRKTIGKKLLEEVPVALCVYDLLEEQGVDLRERPLSWRRERLEQLISSTADARLVISPLVSFQRWDDLAALRRSSRGRRVEGLMLKRCDSPYRVGRVRGDWWKWKIEPYTIDAVLIYAQKGHGKRASLFTDYTFGVWDNGQLVPIAKAYSGLTDAEIREVDAFIRQNTTEKFGPVRTVKPELVFELGFEGIQASPRHKSGIAVRFPRMLRWRTDKKKEEADTLQQVKALLNAEAVR